MKITALTQLRRTLTPTGVGVHIIEMVRELARRDGIDVNLLVASKQLDAKGKIQSQYPLCDFPAHGYPLAQRPMEALWRVLRYPPAEWWCSKTDWLYCPAETFVPTRKIRSVVTVHDLYFMEKDLPWSNTPEHRAAGKRWHRRCRQIVAHADLLLAVSSFTKERMVQLLDADPDKITVIGNGVSEAYFSPDPTAKRPMDQPYVLVVGGLTERKNAQAILNAARQLPPDTQVLVAGKNSKPNIQLARECKNVHLLGYVQDKAMPSLMAGAVCLLFLSRYEGFGMPAAEAMAVGTPVVVSHHAALPQVVGDAGLIVDPNQTGEVVERITTLASDRALRADLIQRGQQRAREFTWARCVDHMLKAMKIQS